MLKGCKSKNPHPGRCSGVQGGIKPSSTYAVPASGTKTSHSSANNSFTKLPPVSSFLHNNTMQRSKPQTPVRVSKYEHGGQ